LLEIIGITGDITVQGSQGSNVFPDDSDAGHHPGLSRIQRQCYIQQIAPNL